MKRRNFLSQSAALGGTLAVASPAHATFGLLSGGRSGPSLVRTWNQALNDTVARTVTLVTIAARAGAMVNEAIYNAWAAYDLLAAFTQPWLYKRPLWEWNDTTKSIALCHAAHAVLVDLFPAERAVFDALLASKTPSPAWVLGGYAAADHGRQAAARVLQQRHQDGSNQLGDLAPGAYQDWTGYQPVNSPDQIVDINRWQPLRLPNAQGVPTVQRFLTPHWGRVKPFALSSGAQFRPTLTPLAPTMAEMLEVIRLSAELDDVTKSQCDFWAANPGSVQPPGMWLQFAEQVSDQDCNSLDDDVKLFFTVGMSMLDNGIACWDAKRTWDSVRPVTAIPYYFRGQTIRAWGGSLKGTVTMLADQWRPFQRPINTTPPFPDFVSGHSSYSAAAAAAMASLRGSDAVTLTGVVPAGSFKIEPGLPRNTITFTWSSFSAAADHAGYSRRLCGIHWEQSDLKGRVLGRQVGNLVAAKCKALFAGRYF